VIRSVASVRRCISIGIVKERRVDSMDDSQFKIVKLEGRLDTARLGEIEHQFNARIGVIKDPAVKVIIDLKDVTFIASLGIRMLITAGKILDRRQVPLAIIAPSSESVMDAIKISGLTEIFRFADSEAAAQAIF